MFFDAALLRREEPSPGGRGRIAFFARGCGSDDRFTFYFSQSLPQLRALEIEMGRPARFIPENKDGVLVEVTCRTTT